MEIQEFKERKNVHQTHFEDLVLLGHDGLAELNDKIEKFAAELSGQESQLNTTVKIDGSPACICWHTFPGYPDNSICLKSFVNGANNALSSREDIQAKYGDRPDMAEKLLYCLELAKCIPDGEAWQGDCLYTKGDLKEREIGGTNYLTFHPNKIIYAFSEDNPTYETIKNSNFGICFHTIYKAGTEDKKTQSFRVDAKRLNNVPDDIYVMSPALDKTNAKFNTEELKQKYAELVELESQLLSNSDYEDLCDNTVFMNYWNTFENANLSDKRAVNINVDTFFEELRAYIKDKQEKEFNKKLSTLKTDSGKAKATDKYNSDVIEVEDILNTNKEVIILLVKTLNKAADIKMLIWNGMKDIDQGYNTFYKSKSQGYIPANMEGIAMSDADGNIVKVVDRSTFSFANRSDDIESGFEHNESLEEEADWVKNIVNTVQNSDKDPAVIATKAYHAKKNGKKPIKGAVISSTPGLVGAVGESLTEAVDDTNFKADKAKECVYIICQIMGIKEDDLAKVIDINDVEAVYNYAFDNNIRINNIIWQEYKDYDTVDPNIFLVHGSRSGIKGDIRLDASGESNDFGNGFYCGTSIDQAAMFVAEEDNSSLYIISFDPANLKAARFKVDTDWMLAVAYYRGTLDKYKNNPKLKAIINRINRCDYIIAPIADNRMFETIDAFVSGNITDKQCLYALSTTNLGYQYVFKNSRTLPRLDIVEHLYLCEAEKDTYKRKADIENTTSLNKALLAKNKFANDGQYIDELLTKEDQ